MYQENMARNSFEKLREECFPFLSPNTRSRNIVVWWMLASSLVTTDDGSVSSLRVPLD